MASQEGSAVHLTHIKDVAGGREQLPFHGAELAVYRFDRCNSGLNGRRAERLAAGDVTGELQCREKMAPIPSVVFDALRYSSIRIR
jgi:hypothetical protein